ncbi:MAG: hypothetical protein U5N58_06615 [Actinomycetota bacterium]|nr:hypothetical protein [Actinomycetota bacterium]
MITETDPGSCWNVEVSGPGITGVTPDSGNRTVTIAATAENIDGLDGATCYLHQYQENGRDHYI